MPKEQSKVWRNSALPSVELLSAKFTKFEFSKHWHDELSIGVIEEGAEGLFYRGENVLIPERQIVAINPGEVHTGFAGAEQGWRYRMFYFDVDEVMSHFDQVFDPIVDRSVINDPDLFCHLRQLHLSLELPSFDLTKSSLYSLCLETLFEKYGAKRENGLRALTKEVKKAKAYLDNRWQGNPSLEELEQEVGCSKFHLLRSFKAKFGVTPHQYLLLIKAKNAKQYLINGVSCVETSLACGFYDQSHFNRNFKRAFGVTPSKFSIV